MTKEQLDRIKKAYSSGLKVQIWFNGYWEDFDIRDYSMYSEPFSENRQYRIIGSDYVDIAENQIAELEKENERLKGDLELWESGSCRATNLFECGVVKELKEQIEKMKQCGNCGNGTIGNCEYCKRKPNQILADTLTSDYWRLKEIKRK